MAKRESIGQRLHRLRIERGLSQRDLSSPGVSYAYISRIEAGTRTPSVKALPQVAGKLGVSVEHLETGKPTPIERGIADAALDFGSLTAVTSPSVV
jgi:transcriptional regulator with XRE-family HTH domain